MRVLKIFGIGICCGLILSAFFGCSSTLPSQSLQPGQVEDMLRNHHFEFKAHSMTGLRGRKEILSPGYGFKIMGDTVHSELPYKGESTQAPMNPEDAGYFFTSLSFRYDLNPRSEKSWMLKLEISDQRFARAFHLLVFENGKAELDIYSNFRDPIHFQGSMEAIEQP